MLALYTFIPLYCPSCGIPTRLDSADNAMSGKFKAHQALTCVPARCMDRLAEGYDGKRWGYD